MEEKVRKEVGLSVEELEAHGSVELLPDREELHHRRRNINLNVALASAQQGAVAQANQGVFFNF